MPTQAGGSKDHHMYILECESLTKRFGGLVALDNVSFSTKNGEILGLIGPNGAGKTTLFNVIAGLHRPSSGHVRFKGEVISKYPPHKICKKGIARTFQIPQPFKGLTVVETVTVGTAFGNLGAGRFKESDEVIDLVGLSEQTGTLVENLTIANQKKGELAKALATNPSLLLLDEVAAGLNPAEQDHLSELVMKIHHTLNITIIMVEHIMRTVMGLSHRVVVLDMGRVLKDGNPEFISRDREVIEAYLGEDYVEYAER
jgi:branched-chain amino acid transport system ATP-binding protein